jgi:uncharacterized protein DUF11
MAFMARRRRFLTMPLLGVAALLAICSATASARVAADEPDGTGTDLFVTFAARECASYKDIRANLARNNIMESLEDLGEDSLYKSGQQVNPVTEALGQPKCKPIDGWKFTLGSGIEERAVTGPWGALSIVTNPFATSIVTESPSELRGFRGRRVGEVALHGVATIELGDDEAALARQGALWVQGGTPTDPVLFGEPQFDGKYGFGALRCALDDVNGDNVEWIGFPEGGTHVFCYAYYVTPPPSSGKIVIRKEVRGAGIDPELFNFAGSISYNPGGAFALKAGSDAPEERIFYRGQTVAGDEPWTAREEVPKGWELASLNCTHGASQVTVDRAKAEVSIALTADDTVTCTYVDRLAPTVGALILRKVTEGGVGAFRYRVLDGDGEVVATRGIETEREAVPAYAKPVKLAPGSYTVLERSPADPKGEWRTVDVACNGREKGRKAGVGFTIKAGSGVVCAFTNRLVYPGQIQIAKETIGNTGTAGFDISSGDDPALELHQFAVVKKEGEAVRAKGDSSRGLPYGTYSIQEFATHEEAQGAWALVEVSCNGRVRPFEQGRVKVRLSRSAPRLSCKFVNRFSAKPPEPPSPEPNPGGSEPDLTIDKRLLSSSGGTIPTQVFLVTVRNPSSVAATEVVVADQAGPELAVVAAKPSQGSCALGEPVVCQLGTIPAGGSASIRVTTRNYSTSGTYNRAVVGSASAEADAENNVATISVVPGVRPAPPVPCRVSGPVAHTSC